jgi:hypothetical protein
MLLTENHYLLDCSPTQVHITSDCYKKNMGGWGQFLLLHMHHFVGNNLEGKFIRILFMYGYIILSNSLFTLGHGSFLNIAC